MNVKDIPRTIDAVRNLPTKIRYRIAMQVGAIPSDKDALAALAERPLDEQAQIILSKLLEIDAAGGSLPATPPPAQQVVRNPDPVPHQVQQPVPQQMGAPPQQLGNHPAAMGVHPGVGVAPQQLGQPVQQPIRTPATAQDPGVHGPSNGAAQAAVATNSLLTLSAQVTEIIKKIDTEVPGFEEHEELKDAIMGLATGVNTLVIIGLLILEKANNDLMPRNLIYDMIREELADRTSEQLMGALRGPSQGK